MTGIYYNLRYHFAFEWGFSTTNYGTDEFIVGGDGSNAMWNSYISSLSSDIPVVNINTTHAYDVWDNMYAGIATANTLIKKCETYTGSKKMKHWEQLISYVVSITLNYYVNTGGYLSSWNLLPVWNSSSLVPHHKK
jgi:hypothetical protein